MEKNTENIWIMTEKNDCIKYFFLFNSANVPLLFSTILDGDAKIGNETKLVQNQFKPYT